MRETVRQGWRLFYEKCFSHETEAALHRCSYKNVFWKYAANLQENTEKFTQFELSCAPGLGTNIFQTSDKRTLVLKAHSKVWDNFWHLKAL